ncbi:hypothetical protein [Methanosphaera stadtmanae]|uniref:hypothetical protein n=1 Tax=Methanosphaera stadtmanae TaxID=2317 RepID=UPI0026DC0E7D|nr:hypothetical protein [Methanosphaera stadtmanae]
MKNKTIIFSIIIIISLISLSTLSATNIDSTDTPIHEKQTDTQQVNIKLPTNKIIEETTNVNKKDIVKKNKTTKKQINKTHSINKTKKDNNKTQTIKTKTNITKSYNDSLKNSACCSVVIQVSDKESIISFRRDSSYRATITIEKTKWYGTNITRQLKTQNGYFTHVIVTQDGWVMGFGGSDKIKTQADIVKTAGEMYSKRNISYSGMSKIFNLLKTLNIGHTVIKSPNGTVGVAAYNSGGNYRITKINNGGYVCIPNNFKYYHTGSYSKYAQNSIDAAIQIAGHDVYGINRRNIITYHSTISSNNQKLNVYVTNDDGRYVSKSTYNLKDPINFIGKTIDTSQIPRIPNKKFIGSIEYKSPTPPIPSTYIITNNAKYNNNIYNVFNRINKYANSNNVYNLNFKKGIYYFDGIENNTLKIGNKNIKNVTIIMNGNNSIFSGKDKTRIIDIVSNFNVIIKNISFVNGNSTNGGAISNNGNLSIVSCVFKNNKASNGGAIYNHGILNVDSSVFTYNTGIVAKSIYNNGSIISINNNWWGLNNPDWSKLLYNMKKPDTYVVMKFTNVTSYYDSEMMFKATLNQLNNHKTITTIPIREIKLYSSLSNVQFKIKINQEAIFSYCAPPATVKVKIDEQEMAYTINKINLKVSLIGSDKIQIKVTDRYNKTVPIGNVVVNINGKNIVEKTALFNVTNGVTHVTIPSSIRSSKYTVTTTYLQNNIYPQTSTKTTLMV